MEESAVAPPCYNKDLFPVAKGKRTKRYRPHSPIPFTITIAGEHDTTTATINHRLTPSFSATSSEKSTTTEEEDTARCLILLANSHLKHSKRHLEAGAAGGTGGGGTCMYACKTCDRVFSSFQALGGHRASHKKPKHEKCDISDNVKIITNNMCGVKPFPSPRIHECSYCGAEFTSGQALGGHMRRHRAAPISLPSNSISVEEPEESNKPRNGLCFDLNLPALEIENKRFGFNSRRQKSPEKLVLSTAAAALVDCHY